MIVMEIIKESKLDLEVGRSATCRLCGCEFKASIKDGRLYGGCPERLYLIVECPQCSGKTQIDGIE